MTDRTDPGGGGMTGATGDLTPDERDEAFVPAELREIDDPASQGDVTASQGHAAPAQRGETGEPGWGTDEGDSTDAPRDAGYGSAHGLNPDDPAYRMESHASKPAPSDRRETGRTELGGDEQSGEEERF